MGSGKLATVCSTGADWVAGAWVPFRFANAKTSTIDAAVRTHGLVRRMIRRRFHELKFLRSLTSI